MHDPTQSPRLKLAGADGNRTIDSVAVDTDKAGFSLSFVEHANLWHEQPLNEDWLGEYVPIGWKPPFPARWTAHFFVTPGGRPSFREPCMQYSFPIAQAKTRLWGVWFEDWNYYPAFFDGSDTILHFEKSFVPNGHALIYSLQPAAAPIFSPCEIVEQVLGSKRAQALFAFDGNALRKLNYSTPAEFIYDRPVCATTTRLSQIKGPEKTTVGVNLATHLYEFIREIRSRVDRFTFFFHTGSGVSRGWVKADPASAPYYAELQGMVTDALSRSRPGLRHPPCHRGNENQLDEKASPGRQGRRL